MVCQCIHFILGHYASKSKVWYFEGKVFSNENISACKITMNYVQSRQKFLYIKEHHTDLEFNVVTRLRNASKYNQSLKNSSHAVNCIAMIFKYPSPLYLVCIHVVLLLKIYMYKQVILWVTIRRLSVTHHSSCNLPCKIKYVSLSEIHHLRFFRWIQLRISSQWFLWFIKQ